MKSNDDESLFSKNHKKKAPKTQKYDNLYAELPQHL